MVKPAKSLTLFLSERLKARSVLASPRYAVTEKVPFLAVVLLMKCLPIFADSGSSNPLLKFNSKMNSRNLLQIAEEAIGSIRDWGAVSCDDGVDPLTPAAG